MDALTEGERGTLISLLPAEAAEAKGLDAWISGASFRVSRKYFGEAYVYALSLVVAHKWAMSAGRASGAPGAVSSVREGDLSVSYASVANADDGDLSATSYGQEYLSMLRQYRPVPGLTGPAFRRGR